MGTLRYRAMAKVNLGLDVLGRRADGYHDVKMVMQTVGIYDVLEFAKLPEDEIRIVLEGEGMSGGTLPLDENNLIYQAAKLIKENCRLKAGILVSLTKHIPVAAGMAGGSVDAATTMIGMNRLFGLGLSLERLQEFGVRIGADVPYCLTGGTALAEGIGEVLTKLPDVPEAFLAVVKPEIAVSTKFVYENLHAESLREHPDIDGMTTCICEGDLAGMAMRMENVLERVTVKQYPVIAGLKDFLRKQGALNALMSGSGPVVFGVFKEKERAKEACEALRKSGMKQVFLTGFVREACVEV